MQATTEHPRAGITDQVVERYAEKVNADEGITAWATTQARHALERMPEGEAILHGINEIDFYQRVMSKPSPEVVQFVRDAGMEA